MRDGRREGFEWGCEADEKPPKRLGISARRLDGLMQLISIMAVR